MRPAAGAGAGKDAGQVARAVADHRHRLPVERRHHQFAGFAIGEGRQRLRVDDLDDVGIFPDMQPVLLGTFESDARAVHLGKPERVVGLDAEHRFDAPPMLLGMRLGADDQRMQPRIPARVQPFGRENLVQPPQVAGNRMRHRRAEIPHQLDLAQAVAGAGGNRQAAESFDAVLEAEAAGEQPVTGHVLENVRLAHPGGVERARHQVRPAFEVMPVVKDDGRIARRAA